MDRSSRRVVTSGSLETCWNVCQFQSTSGATIFFGFVQSDFESKITSELLNYLGNFIFRTLSLCRKIKSPFRLSSEEYQSYQTQVSHLVQNYETSMDATRFRRALDLILELGCLGNHFLQRKAPWTFSPEHKQYQDICALACTTVTLLGTMLMPFLPTIETRLSNMFNFLPTLSLRTVGSENGNSRENSIPSLSNSLLISSAILRISTNLPSPLNCPSFSLQNTELFTQFRAPHPM